MILFHHFTFLTFMTWCILTMALFYKLKCNYRCIIRNLLKKKKKVNLDQKLGKRINCVGFKRGLIVLQQHKRKDLQNNQYEEQNEHRMFISSSATHSSSKLHCCTWIKFWRREITYITYSHGKKKHGLCLYCVAT